MTNGEAIVWQCCLKAAVDLVNKTDKTPAAILKEVRGYRDNLFLDFKKANDAHTSVNYLPKNGEQAF